MWWRPWRHRCPLRSWREQSQPLCPFSVSPCGPLDPKKSAGSDELAAFFVKTAATIIAAPIENLCNISLQTAEIPADSHRPISIWPCVSKVFEKLVNKQLTSYFNAYGVLSGVQFGFCAGYGCTTAPLKVLNDTTSALDAKQHCAAVFGDLAKAFDTVDHTILVSRAVPD